MTVQVVCACGWTSAWVESPSSRALMETIVQHQQEAHPGSPLAVTLNTGRQESVNARR